MKRLLSIIFVAIALVSQVTPVQAAPVQARHTVCYVRKVAVIRYVNGVAIRTWATSKHCVKVGNPGEK